MKNKNTTVGWIEIAVLLVTSLLSPLSSAMTAKHIEGVYTVPLKDINKYSILFAKKVVSLREKVLKQKVFKSEKQKSELEHSLISQTVIPYLSSIKYIFLNDGTIIDWHSNKKDKYYVKDSFVYVNKNDIPRKLFKLLDKGGNRIEMFSDQTIYKPINIILKRTQTDVASAEKSWIQKIKNTKNQWMENKKIAKRHSVLYKKYESETTANLLKNLRSNDSVIRMNSVFILGKQKRENAYKHITRLLHDKSTAVRCHAITSLEMLGDKKAIAPLINRLKVINDNDEARYIFIALKRITGKNLGYTKTKWINWWKEEQKTR